jgi:cytochrome c biogenesis factor
MVRDVNLDSVRAAALARIDRSERNFKLAFFAAFIVESAFVVSFLLLADFSNRLHVLLLISTVSCYSIVVLGLVALGAHINRGIARVLKAVELLPDAE